MDVGWPVSAAIGYSTQVGSVIFIIGILVNLIMLLTRLTKTLDVDIWNYWHWAFSGGLIAAVTGNFWWGVVAAVVHAVITLIMGDLTAPMLQEYYGWPDISISHGGAMGIFLTQYPFVKLFNALGWKDESEEKVDLEKIRQRAGLFSDPIMIGLLVGGGLAILAQINSGKDFYTMLVDVVKVAINAAAVMFIIPKMVAILMEGLIPVSEQARIFLEKRFGGSDRKFYIGMDSAIMLGDEMVLTLGIVMVPITIILALIMPWNHMMPFGILPSLPYYMVNLPPLTKGNFWKALAVATCGLSLTITMGSIYAPAVTQAAIGAGYVLPEGTTLVSGGANIITFVMYLIASFFTK